MEMELVGCFHRAMLSLGGNGGNFERRPREQRCSRLRGWPHRASDGQADPHHPGGSRSKAGQDTALRDGPSYADPVDHLHAEITDLGPGAPGTHCLCFRRVVRAGRGGPRLGSQCRATPRGRGAIFLFAAHCDAQPLHEYRRRCQLGRCHQATDCYVTFVGLRLHLLCSLHVLRSAQRSHRCLLPECHRQRTERSYDGDAVHPGKQGSAHREDSVPVQRD
mmetsp:Transcript_47211/g.110324  ORF Transcript_47211/g.110324 Transcript_47211/m.110324 type:complete len:220 (+) Transcript_47211:851-1510(+)